ATGSNPVYFVGKRGGVPGIGVYSVNNNLLTLQYDMFNGKNGQPAAYFINNKITVEDKRHVWLGADLGLILFDPTDKSYTIYNQLNGQKLGTVLHAFVLNSRYLLVSTATQGLCVFDKQKKTFIAAYRHIPGDPDGIASNNLGNIIQTKDGHIVVEVQELGLDIISSFNNPFYKIFSKQESEPAGITNTVKNILPIDPNTIWAVNYDNQIVSLNPTTGAIQPDLLLNKINAKIKNGDIGQLLKTPDGKVWICWEKNLMAVDLQLGLITDYSKYLKNIPQTGSSKRRNISGAISCIASPAPDKLLMTDKSSLYYITYGNTSFRVSAIPAFDTLGSATVIKIYYSPKNNKSIVLAEWGGRPVVIDNNSNGEPKVLMAPWLDTKANDVLDYEGKDTVVLCAEDGLFFFDMNTGNSSKIETNALLTNQIFSGNKLNDTYWLSTPDGLVQVNASNFSTGSFLPKTMAGMQSFVEGSTAAMPDGTVFFGGSNGIVAIPPGMQKKKPDSLPVLISEIMVNERKYSEMPDKIDRLSLPKDSNTLAIKYNIVSFNEQLPQLKYRLSGIDKNWVANNMGQVRYANLPFGKYNFEIKQEGMSEPGKQLSVVIRPGWYESWWFRTGALLLLLTIAFVIVRQQMNNIRQRNMTLKKEAELKQTQMMLEKRIAESEMAALRSQMNPHFIFNVLNSINRFILSNNGEDASKYLTGFSRLIRLVLENSNNSRVTLQKDIEALQLYIQMEKLRFTDRFNYSINVSPEIDTLYTQVPPLLVQPYVENAIWHGLMHKTDPENLVTITYSLEDDNLLKIEIQDNGVGRAAAAEYKSKSATQHKSFGMQITKDRIAIVNQISNINVGVTIDDLYNNQGIACGTKVTLMIPV
ncbi:MAG: histidine kinase, partial [Chitinophagaceae bacterium]|nr:histidine kinase [Chitinophagaceae bacterium]